MLRRAVGVFVLLVVAPALAAPGTLHFSALEWHVKEGRFGPGPNEWDPGNVFVDALGHLHLRIAPHPTRGWTTAEVWTVDRFGEGAYSFRVRAPFALLDPHAVLGLFTYGPPEAGPDGTHEVDVEVSRWGDPDAPLGHDVVYPAVPGLPYTRHDFDVPADTAVATFSFVRGVDAVAFSAVSEGPLGRPLDAWTFAPPDADARIPRASAPIHLNLWLMGGLAPARGLPVEVVVEAVAAPPAVG